MTNADRIREMTDEDLAEWFTELIQDCDCNTFPCKVYCKTEPGCDNAWLKWLKQEADNA